MCGIAGVINHQGIDLNALVQSLYHRGPDYQNIFTDDDVALVHTRLAIQDILNGAQPFSYEHYTIVFNGEIYNHLELRTQLPQFQFQTKSDTETLLYLYMQFGLKMFDLLEGMFAFCIYDQKNKKIILARDRAGKKPLYYSTQNNRFVFASEINALKTIIPLSIDEEVINSYLRSGFIWRPYTAYSEVYKLEAASYLVLDVVNLKSEKTQYFNILDCFKKAPPVFNFDQSLEMLETKLQSSVASRIQASDVDVGVFLSGGIDSNLIAAMAAQVKPGIKTFTVKFNGLYDESALARLTAQRYQTEHIELEIAQDFSHNIENILRNYGEPFMDSSAIPSYYVSQAARQSVKVVLSGDGADEMFGGYRRYVPVAYHIQVYAKLFSFFLKFLPQPQFKQSLYNYFHRLMSVAGKKNLDYYLSTTTDIFEDVIKLPSDKITLELAAFIESVFKVRDLSALKKMLYADYSILLFCDLLVKMDIASMTNSLEVRSPFLAKEILEFAPNLPDHFKINNFKTKYILRKLAQKYLPLQLVSQPKRGFEVPLKKWVDEDLRAPIFDSLKPGCFSEKFVTRGFIRQLLDKKIAVTPEKRAKIIWSFYCLEVWAENAQVTRADSSMSMSTASIQAFADSHSP